MYIDFDTKTVQVDGNTLTFGQAVAQGIITQEELTRSEMRFLAMALIDIEDAGYKDVTDEANQQNGSNHWYVFANEKGVHYCDTIDDVLDLAETVG